MLLEDFDEEEVERIDMMLNPEYWEQQAGDDDDQSCFMKAPLARSAQKPKKDYNSQ